METKNSNGQLKVINLFTGPGSGKSTIMAGLFYELKRRGYCCEMTPEYAKDKVYGENWKDMDNQFYIGAKQYHKLFRLQGKVDYAISDSPLLLSIYYDRTGNMNFRGLMVDLFKQFDNINFFIERDKDIPYEESGRLQTLEESIEIDKNIRHILVSSSIPFISVPSKDAVFKILDHLAELRGKEKGIKSQESLLED